MSSTQKIYTGYKPRYHQESLHKKLKRFNVLVCHRRFGKTVFTINEMIDQGIRCPKRNPQYAYIAPNYGQAKRVAWEMLKEYTEQIPGRSVNEQELRVDIARPWMGDRVRYMLLGAEQPGSLRGIYLDGAILDEFAEMHPEVWGQVIRPALADRAGWAIFIGTPKGTNHFYEMYMYAKEEPEWVCAVYKASETDILPESELEAARREMSEEEYDQEFECSFSAALVGAFFGKEMAKAEEEGRICRVPYEKKSPVYTAWDLGVDDTTAIWCLQEIGKEYRAIDYIEESGQGLEYFVGELNKRGYIFDSHYFPHDIRVRELGLGGESREKMLRDLGLRNIRVGVKHTANKFLDDIHNMRMAINKMWFDQTKCKRGIDSLKNYERKWDTKNKIFQQRPLHNWASHGADAFREFADQHRESSNRPDFKNLPRQTDRKYSVFG